MLWSCVQSYSCLSGNMCIRFCWLHRGWKSVLRLYLTEYLLGDSNVNHQCTSPQIPAALSPLNISYWKFVCVSVDYRISPGLNFCLFDHYYQTSSNTVILHAGISLSLSLFLKDLVMFHIIYFICLPCMDLQNKFREMEFWISSLRGCKKNPIFWNPCVTESL